MGFLRFWEAGSITTIIVSFQLLGFVSGLARSVRPMRSLLRTTARFGRRVDPQHRLSLSSIDEGDKLFEGCGVLATCWVEYKKAVQTESKNLPRPEEHFSYYQLIVKNCNRQFSEMLPSILTGLGILGTFIGLVQGLSEISVSDVVAIRDSIGTLTHGMSTAFHTSIWGIMLSLIWSFVDRRLLKKAQDNMAWLHHELRKVLPSPSEWELLDTIARFQSEQLATFKSFVSDTLIPDIIDGFRDVLDQTLSPHLEQTTKVFEKFSDASSSKQVEGIERMASSFMDELNNAFDGQLVALSDSIKDMVEWQSHVKQDMMELSSSVSSAAMQQYESMRVSKELLNSIESTVLDVRAIEETLQHLQEALETDTKMFSVACDRLVELNEVSTLTLQTSVNALDVMRASTEKHIATLNSQITEMREFWQDASESLNNTRDQMVSGVSIFNEELEDGLKFTFDQYDRLLAEATGRLRVLVSDINESVKDLPDEMMEIGGALEELKRVVQVAVTRLENDKVAMSDGDRWEDVGG